MWDVRMAKRIFVAGTSQATQKNATTVGHDLSQYGWAGGKSQANTMIPLDCFTAGNM